jgi:hypothetical protein
VPDSHDGNPVVTIIVLLVVGAAAAGTFVELNHRSSRPEASGAGGVGADATANMANRR